MSDSPIPITVRGDVDDRAVEQLRRCAEAGDATAGVLCADGHVGYSQPIGGAIAYPDHISPSGVGYDIGCIAAGERVVLADGSHVAIEDLQVDHRPVRPNAAGVVGPVSPYLGLVSRGVRDVLKLVVDGGRTVRLTPDHEIRTLRGWVRAHALTTDDRVLCPAFAGLPHAPSATTAEFVRLASYVNGDGSIPSAKAAAVSTAVRERTGDPRVSRDCTPTATALGDCVWARVIEVAPDGRAPTFDVVTDDPEQAFVASGITVHNCGNKAVRTDLLANDIAGDLPRLMDEVVDRISFGVGRKNDEPVDHPVLDAIFHADFRPQRKLFQSARNQLGTVGAGNHYVDLFAGDDGHVWVGVHFGSRGFGHKTASGFLSLAGGGEFGDRAPDGEMDAPPTLLHVDSELGQSYIAAMTLAGDYAYAGRDVVVDKVLEILGATSTYAVHNHHNYAWRETHGGVDVWVIRKGCTPAFPGQEGFVGATMGEDSVILRGRDSAASADLLFSTVHGAGRVMSRTQAAGRVGTRAECHERDCAFWVTWAHYRHERDRAGVEPKVAFTLCPEHPSGTMLKRRGRVKAGRIDFDVVQAALSQRGIELRGGAADEAPDAYKRLDTVLAAHADTIDVLHRLMPIGVAMAPSDTVDPFKD